MTDEIRALEAKIKFAEAQAVTDDGGTRTGQAKLDELLVSVGPTVLSDPRFAEALHSMMQKAASEARVLLGGAIASAAASCAPATPSGGIMAHYAASDGRDVPGTSSTYSPTLSPTSSDMCAFQVVGVTRSYGPAAVARPQQGPHMAKV